MKTRSATTTTSPARAAPASSTSFSVPATTSSGATATAIRQRHRPRKSPTPIPSPILTTNTPPMGGSVTAPTCAMPRGYCRSCPISVPCRMQRANCDAGHYYMLNNTNPGFLPNGAVDTKGIASGGSFPPSSVRTIGDALNDKSISWAYYGGAYNAAVNLANGSTNPADAVGMTYCPICNFEAYASSIMGDPTQRAAHIKDATDFYAAVGDGSLPAVSF